MIRSKRVNYSTKVGNKVCLAEESFFCSFFYFGLGIDDILIGHASSIGGAVLRFSEDDILHTIVASNPLVRSTTVLA